MNSLNGGYAMIKYNSTQEELQIAYRSKKPVLCYDENRRAHWAVIEETATESVDEETQEPITIYEYSYRLIDEASGGKLYRHRIAFTSSAGVLYTEIYNANEVAYTISSLGNEFGQFYDFPTTIEFSFSDSKLMIGVGVGQNQNVIRMKEINTSFMESTSEITSITDTVTLIL